MSVVVRGAGVAGLAAALELARHGLQVTVVERRPAIGLGASHWAGGMLAPFCEGEVADPSVVERGRTAAAWWEAAVPGSVTQRGTLVLSHPRDRADLARFAARTTGHRRVEAAAIAALEPDLGHRFDTGLFFEAEAHLDPRKALQGLHDAALRQGVRFLFGQEALPGGKDEVVVDCRGPDAIGGIAGLRGVRGEMLILETRDITLSRPVRLLHPRHPLYLVPRGGSRLMVGATMIETEDAGPVSVRSMMELLNAAYALHPALAEARIVETGTGVRPAFPDNVPRLVETAEGFALAGMYRHGFLLAPALALELAARLTASRMTTERKTA